MRRILRCEENVKLLPETLHTTTPTFGGGTFGISVRKYSSRVGRHLSPGCSADVISYVVFLRSAVLEPARRRHLS